MFGVQFWTVTIYINILMRTSVLCNVIKIAQGNVGKTISILVIISIAIGLFLGKITWGVAIAVSVGLGVLFGANSVVEFIASGKGGAGPCPKNN